MTASRFQVMRPLTSDEYSALKADIQQHGCLVAVEYDQYGEIIDGHHRVRACQELGITEWPRSVRSYATDAERATAARALNTARRHLTRGEKRTLIEAALRQGPDRSDRVIAASLGVDHTTVGVARRRLEATGGIHQLDLTTGADGRARHAKRASPAIALEPAALYLPAPQIDPAEVPGEAQAIIAALDWMRDLRITGNAF